MTRRNAMNSRNCQPLWLGAAILTLALAGCSSEDDSDAPTKPAKTKATKASNATESKSQAGAAAPETAGAAAPTTNTTNTTNTDDADCADRKFDSTFAAIQKVIFEGHSCTNDMCHGAATMGGLDLRPDVAYKNLIEVKSTLGTNLRVMPGVPGESFLFNKLRAATEPDSVKVEGSSMPSGAAPLSAEHLEAVRRWIETGAPKEGSVGDSITGQSDKIAKLLGSCLPTATPLAITPLSPPEPNEGVQLAMAPVPLPAATEIDVCFAQYYDLSNVVPKEFQDPESGVFFVDGQRLRQDPQSHHLLLLDPKLGSESVNDPSLGAWKCRGGDVEGTTCDPLKSAGCGAGQCASEVQNKAACINFGPANSETLAGQGRVAGAQTAQYYQAPREGVYTTFPLRGLLYWNSHSFNLTTSDATLHAWINMSFAKDRTYKLETLAITKNIAMAAGTPPFTSKVYCADWVAPQNSRMYTLSSHTHKRGRNFTVDLDGERIYQSARYTDPVEKMFDPPLAFDSADESKRTLKYCAEFNNGVTQDGEPDLDLVTRLSTMPDRTTCKPVACVGGKIGSPCGDNGACDSSAGASDGWCDACAITAGQTTENEMFVLSPSIVLKP
jgi:hypothetical protein